MSRLEPQKDHMEVLAWPVIYRLGAAADGAGREPVERTRGGRWRAALDAWPVAQKPAPKSHRPRRKGAQGVAVCVARVGRTSSERIERGVVPPLLDRQGRRPQRPEKTPDAVRKLASLSLQQAAAIA